MIYVLDKPEDLFDLSMDLGGCTLLALDTETSPREVAYKEDGSYDDAENKVRGLDPYLNRLRLIQFCAGDDVYVLNMDKIPVTEVKQLQHILNKALVVGANLSFDAKILYHHTGLRMTHMWDVSIMERMLRAGEFASNGEWYTAASLAGVIQTYLGIEISKEVRATFAYGLPLTQEQIDYSAKDVLYLIPAYYKQALAIEENGLKEAAIIENKAINGFAQMELNGMPIDTDKWLKLAESAEQKVKDLYNGLQLLYMPDTYKQLFGDAAKLCLVFDPASPKQTVAAMRRLGIDVEDAEEVAIQLAIARYPEHVEKLKALLSFKEAAKQSTTYGRDWIKKHVHPVTGRVHSHIDQYGAVTGRTTSSNPNLQNIPSREDVGAAYRACFALKDTSRRLISVDWTGAEMVLIAYLSQEPALMSVFNAAIPQDVHATTACRIYGYDYDWFIENYKTNNKLRTQRTMAKTTNFGIPYGIGPQKLMNSTNIAVREAGIPTKEIPDMTIFESKKFLAQYAHTYPVLTAWLTNQERTAQKSLQVRGIVGHRRIFRRPDSNDAAEYRKQQGAIGREAKNCPFQNGNAVLAKRVSWSLLHKYRIQDYGALLCNFVHDEFVTEAPVEMAEKVKELMEEAMVEAGIYFLKDTDIRKAVKIGADGSIGMYWGK